MDVGTTLDGYVKNQTLPDLFLMRADPHNTRWFCKSSANTSMHLNSEKLSRLFADLRRESAATGSFPFAMRRL